MIQKERIVELLNKSLEISAEIMLESFNPETDISKHRYLNQQLIVLKKIVCALTDIYHYHESNGDY